MNLILGAALSGAIALVAWWRGALSLSGALAALAAGTLIYVAGGPPWFAALMGFFITSTLLGRVGRAAKSATKREFSKGDRRDAWQVLANGGVAAACAAGALVHPWAGWQALFLGALATANGDTWATELGVLSSRDPVSLVRFVRVPRGTSGAVSPLGLLATAAGAAAIGVPFWSGKAIAVAALSGTLGSLADSLLGVTVQTRFHCPRCDKQTEGARHHCGADCQKLGGWIGNDGVNFLATLTGAALATLF